MFRPLGLAALFAVTATAALAGPAMTVAKDPSCGCCTAWAAIMERAGYDVAIEHTTYDALDRLKAARGIPATLAGCHTATVQGYTIEGHVPAADIDRLLAERPDAVGLAVPGMPMGSPGMGPESSRDAYDVLLVMKDGTVERFAHHPAR
ncbi:hypothetical protein OCGS_2689 [Oceaniovalibus guishaninsula JLT2003]|uniref:Metal-binding protein n=1 Tax=Oceaniovalibus guishaninsula JLT2003 TaxID=1231392 RepID=K2H689_9RHOB|nr:DUF411 domain-containing protein [Oceaniovalibus guishaninsula]EKE43098.1 hypothetical protein OCGS_2689 [Oceaniovalibus guishaninsula JLT2003]